MQPDNQLINTQGIERALTDIVLALTGRPNIYVDANGWTVYDYKTHKAYRKSVNQATFNIAASDRAAFTAINLPVGLSVVGSRHVTATMRGTTYPGNFFIGLDTSATSGAITGLVGNNYPGGTLATGAFIIDVTITDLQ